MFISFFPIPRVFFLSAIVWSFFSVLIWIYWGGEIGYMLGFHHLNSAEVPIINIARFWTQSSIWLYVYSTVFLFSFFLLWAVFCPHRWQKWSILGTAFIVFITYFGVVATSTLVEWTGPYLDLVQKALSTHGEVRASEFYTRLFDFAGIAFAYVAADVLCSFFVSHYIFRWRTAMNDYYMEHWTTLRTVEGAAQRVQEDTMRFSSTLEALGVELVRAVMSLAVFLPLLSTLGGKITELPLIGNVPHALVWAAFIWAIFGTGFLALVGIKLPGLEFNNQRVEAAYRKELVLGEDMFDRAGPITVRELYKNVRRNYFHMYLHYCYFNFARAIFGQADALFPVIILIPSIVSGLLTLGLMSQIQSALDSVRSSTQYLIKSWGTIIELLSIYKRLNGFEALIKYD
ncbi:peptide antibiotic transporter SbmA [Ochrobactrum sp. Marseille-Q0166]|uniref:peptide antibiotic transporter SbmA n=1 Tax=Ochrobactrum sp. Marseille-Q0166 TaxID=2761105 RepID=UPI001656064D|nr:peptide antibiotic transporter SbmA [Ochrobactrum sp. Marseille-Q0166]MBC8718026.1 peptide antibiotic transporter SbmA [Ochrobactrum sp. Marseille-Q0166]